MTWIVVKSIQTPSGTVLENQDGSVRSWNPPSPGHWESRAAGASGAYELCAINGAMVAYNPTGNQVVAFGFQASIPNRPGFSAISEQPLS